MKVLKFGGSSVASADAIRKVKAIIEAENEKVIIVVSAFGGVTDILIKVAELATMKDLSYEILFDKLISKHLNIINDIIISGKDDIISYTIKEFKNLGEILKGLSLIGHLSMETRNIVVSYGERLSSFIIAGAIDKLKHYNALDIIKTSPYHNKHTLNLDLSYQLIRNTLGNENNCVILGGFISSDAETNDITNLGRGGSDYTASILASALNAECLEIWTDVDGFMTADPKIISNARTIAELSYLEAMELCNFGAKVIYPPTIYPTFHKNIPIYIKNTFNSKGKGTRISNDNFGEISNASIKGVSSIKDTSLISMTGLGMVGVVGVNHRIFKALSSCGISVFLVSQAASENNTTLGVSIADGLKAQKSLTEEFKSEIERGEVNPIVLRNDVATVAIVGEGMRNKPGIIGKLFGIMGRNGVNIMASAHGAGETNISFILKRDDLEKAINLVHNSFFLSNTKRLNIFISGVGLVGSKLIEQIISQKSRLEQDLNLDLNIVGLANSKRFIYEKNGIDLFNYNKQLADSELVSNPQSILELLTKNNFTNTIFVDCSSSMEVANSYYNLLDKNISVVSANKIAASGEHSYYNSLKKVAKDRGVKYLFETNVGAGLPILKTINDLVNTGDTILKIEAVLSGTLNYIFNTLSETYPFSEAVYKAKEEGYAEPDPRVDLSGEDVVRKLVILSREAGFVVEKSDIKRDSFIENELFELNINDFWKRLVEVNDRFRGLTKDLIRKDEKLRYIATFEKQDHDNTLNLSVGLRRVDKNSPFYDLEGSNNIVLIHSERYKEYPLQIKGYGAGAEVTASGVFADILSTLYK